MIVKNHRRKLFRPSESHTKYKNIDGMYVPSVTTILKIINKDALVYWANGLGWKRKNVKEELEKSALIGTLAHGYIEQILLGDLNLDLSSARIHSTDIYNGVVNSVSSFLKWWKVNHHRIKILKVEHKMTCDEYGGTSDLVCKFDNELCILDFKTSKAFYCTMFLQLAAYAKMYELETGSTIKQVVIFKLDKINGNEADILTAGDVVEVSGNKWTNRDMIVAYMNTFDKVVDLFYDLNDIETEWNY